MSKATVDIMDSLHGAVAAELKQRILDGSASSADISNAIKFLKDNGIEADALANPGVKSLAHAFPEFGADGDEVRPN